MSTTIAGRPVRSLDPDDPVARIQRQNDKAAGTGVIILTFVGIGGILILFVVVEVASAINNVTRIFRVFG